MLRRTLPAIVLLFVIAACGADPEPAPESTPAVPVMADAFAAGATARVTGVPTNGSTPPGQVDAWSSPQRTEVTCQLPPGVEVTVTASAYRSDEGRWYYEVTAGECKGWVASASLAPPAVPAS